MNCTQHGQVRLPAGSQKPSQVHYCIHQNLSSNTTSRCIAKDRLVVRSAPMLQGSSWRRSRHHKMTQLGHSAAYRGQWRLHRARSAHQLVMRPYGRPPLQLRARAKASSPCI